MCVSVCVWKLSFIYSLKREGFADIHDIWTKNETLSSKFFCFFYFYILFYFHFLGFIFIFLFFPDEQTLSTNYFFFISKEYQEDSIIFQS